MGQLSQLTSIHLSHNRFFGTLPDLSKLKLLEELMLDHNWLQVLSLLALLVQKYVI